MLRHAGTPSSRRCIASFLFRGFYIFHFCKNKGSKDGRQSTIADTFRPTIHRPFYLFRQPSLPIVRSGSKDGRSQSEEGHGRRCHGDKEGRCFPTHTHTHTLHPCLLSVRINCNSPYLSDAAPASAVTRDNCGDGGENNKKNDDLDVEVVIDDGNGSTTIATKRRYRSPASHILCRRRGRFGAQAAAHKGGDDHDGRKTTAMMKTKTTPATRTKSRCKNRLLSSLKKKKKKKKRNENCSSGYVLLRGNKRWQIGSLIMLINGTPRQNRDPPSL